ncbi:LysM domain protein [Penicillium taxi]|uniref:LysM domain protein n=1 Tax=Penicillium taxi TaxID=168475 RepID=UPI0025454781|nr:LysM domain protein [Penicillium taxi]KAJ5889009.1 LysM domain protein [Penicillium taxi]
MKLSTFALIAFIGQTACSLAEKRWLDGDSATSTTDPDVTSDCTYWANNISANDTCANIEEYFDATVAQLHAWNPSLLEDYCVLIEGWSYCVDGPAVTSSASSSTATATGHVQSQFSEVGPDVTDIASAAYTPTATSSPASNSTSSSTSTSLAPSSTQQSGASGLDFSNIYIWFFAAFFGLV